MIDFFSDFVRENRERLFLNGFVKINKEKLFDINNYLNSVKRLDDNIDNFETQTKQKGTFTLKQKLQEVNKELFLDNLFNSNLYNICCNVTGQKLYLTNFKHYLTKGITPELGWHRDTYYRNEKYHGLIPTGYKLAIYVSDVQEDDGCTAFVKGSHRIDFNNRYFDFFLTHFSNKIHKVKLKKGDAVLFNVNLIHNRLKAKQYNSTRSVTIFGFGLSKFYQKKYFTSYNQPIIDYFNKELNKEDTW